MVVEMEEATEESGGKTMQLLLNEQQDSKDDLQLETSLPTVTSDKGALSGQGMDDLPSETPLPTESPVKEEFSGRGIEVIMYEGDPENLQMTTTGGSAEAVATNGLDAEESGISNKLNIAEPVDVSGPDTSHADVDLQSADLTELEPSTSSSEVTPTFTLSDMGIGQALQIVNLPDGTTAMIQPYAISSEDQGAAGQTIQLPDGSTAVLQNVPALKVSEHLQTVQLEDGSTAYIAQMNPESMFTEATAIDPNGLNLEQLTYSAAQLTGESGSHIEITPVQAKTAENILTASGVATVMSTNQAMSSERAIALGDKAYQCRYNGCGRLYTTLHHLKVHERSHTGDRPFKCDFDGCGKAFATGYGLKSHTRVHTGEKPYKCPDDQCSKAFKTSGDLQKHVRTHTGERPFKCPFQGCDRAFTTSNIRKVHIRTHTGERPYICTATGCMKSFASATNYKNHIRIHTGEKPYVCTVENCGKRFTEYSSLYKHHVVHTHSKPYVCNRCGKNYRQTSTLAMHKRTLHGEDTTAEQEAALLLQHAGADALEPPSKHPRLELHVPNNLTPLTNVRPANNGTEEEEGTLVINTSEASQQVTMVMSDGIPINVTGVVGDEGMATLQMTQQSATATIQQLAQGQGLTLTASTEGDQQILVVTDPAQVEVLQQLAAQQFYQTAEAESAQGTTDAEAEQATSIQL